MKVDIENGKYTYISHDSGAELLRHGEFWQDVTGQNVWYCAAYELQEAREERDALAAHVERIREAANIVLKNSWSPDHQALNDVLADDISETSLAHLKAEWQAQALEWARENPYAALNTRITELRRQVEEE